MIDKNKTYKTRSGLEVVITFLDGHGNHPIQGRYHANDGWHICTWNEDGFYGSPDRPNEKDLVEVTD